MVSVSEKSLIKNLLVTTRIFLSQLVPACETFMRGTEQQGPESASQIVADCMRSQHISTERGFCLVQDRSRSS